MAENATTGFVRSADPCSGHDRVKTKEPADNRDNEDKREREYDDEGDHVADLLLVRVDARTYGDRRGDTANRSAWANH